MSAHPKPVRRASAALALATLLFGSASVSAYVFDQVQDQEGKWRECDQEDPYGINAPNLQVIFDRSRSMLEPSGINGGPYTKNSDVTKEGQADVGLVFVPAGSRDNPTGRDALSLSNKVGVPPYIWVPSDGYNILSKLNAQTGKEEGRYYVGWNPSRTAVDLDNNAWVGTRQDGMLSKVLALKDACADRNGNGVIDTSTGTNVLPAGTDECILYQDIPRGKAWNSTHNRYMGCTIRGLAAGTDGKMWIGYSSCNGGVQSIDVATFQMGPFVSDNNIPRWDRDANGVFKRNGTSTLSACNVYGLVIDRNGLLYSSDTCRERLPVYDTKTDQWIAIYYLGHPRGMYGLTTDARGRAWIGGWPDRFGVGVFDPDTMKTYYFPNNNGRGTGLGVEPETGDVWANLHSSADWVGRLKVNQTNLGASYWQNIYERPGPRHGGVGFDADGYAWHVGTSRNEAIKIDPATNTVVARYPVGQGGHYMYSDFTGSTAAAFTAPSGRWRNVYPVGVPGQIIKGVKVEAYAPANTSIGVRFRALDRNGDPISGWFPNEVNGSAQFYPYTNGAALMSFPAPQGNDNPFLAEQLEVDIKLATAAVGVRPFIFAVNYDADNSQPAFQAAQDIVVGLSNAASIPGACSSTDATKCDYLRVGLSYFDSTYQQVSTSGEDTSGTITGSVSTATADGLTNLSNVTDQVRTMPSLKDPVRDNYVLIVTDGKVNQKSVMLSAISHLCEARNRAAAPVSTFAMGLGVNSDMNINGLLAAAGGTGQCCVGADPNCATPVNVCDPAVLSPRLQETGVSPYTQVGLQGLSCGGGLTSNDITAFKARLLAAAKESSSRYKVIITDDPVMYNKPTYPQQGLLSDPNATKVELNHIYWNRVELPFCEPVTMTDCGLKQELILNGVSPAVAETFKNEGWYFEDPTKRDVVRLTPLLADEVASRRVKQVTMQAACQCFKPEGTPCTVPGYDNELLENSRCAPGLYACNAQAFDTCVPRFRPMPEICNGLDDDCNAFEDDLNDKRKSTKYGPGKKWDSDMSPNDLKEQKQELTCNFTDVCVCDVRSVAELQQAEKDGDRGHRGQGPSFQEELNDYLQKTFEGSRSCLCGEGLTGEDVQTINALDAQDKGAPASQAPSSSQPQAGGCSSAQTSSAAPLLIFVLSSLFFLPRRRRRREDAA